MSEIDIPRWLLGADPVAWNVGDTKVAIAKEIERAGITDHVVAFVITPYFVEPHCDSPRALEWGARLRVVVRLAKKRSEPPTTFADWVAAWTTPTQTCTLSVVRSAKDLAEWFAESYRWPAWTPLQSDNPEAVSPRVAQLNDLQDRWTKDDFTFVAGAEPGQFPSAFSMGSEFLPSDAEHCSPPALLTRH